MLRDDLVVRIRVGFSPPSRQRGQWCYFPGSSVFNQHFTAYIGSTSILQLDTERLYGMCKACSSLPPSSTQIASKLFGSIWSSDILDHPTKSYSSGNLCKLQWQKNKLKVSRGACFQIVEQQKPGNFPTWFPNVPIQQADLAYSIFMPRVV